MTVRSKRYDSRRFQLCARPESASADSGCAKTPEGVRFAAAASAVSMAPALGRTGVVDVEVVEAPGRAVAAEVTGVRVDPGRFEQPAHLGGVLVGQLLLDAVRAEARDRAADV